MLGARFNPQMPTPLTQTASTYMSRLGWLGSQLLAMLWLFANVNVSLSVGVAVAVGCGVFIYCIGEDYRRLYPQIMAAIKGTDRIRLFWKAWPAFVVIVIVSGLAVDAFSWHQVGEFKAGLLGLASVPYFTWIFNKLVRD